ncbi:hypothetical protein [Streptomyces sp. TS71-3]|uniref:hypothetical protein n=1 Tax=Streptomyces sp. TS71-3 TaxID=2733862 RepID=UPI001B13A85E|nr:hypothetical protein [Streptomyces sp. TS71-3]GHJ35603.1 hypothetical protein Sm713_12120 [Streptomyces sp. TS71-3]
MGWKLTRRAAATSAALVGVVALVAAVLPKTGAGMPIRTAPSFGTVAAKSDPDTQPPPPQLPRGFRGKGTYIVRDLGVTVPFSWQGRSGDSQMVAGGPQYPIWFTNLIYRGSLYTLTYKWPGLTEHPCSRIPGFDLDQLNQAFQTARFVGPETLERNPQRHVNHWRVGVVLPKLPPGNFLRFPLALGDIYVDQGNRGTFWQVLQFGVQNLYDPELDEWLVMDTFEHQAGTVTLPAECSAV